MTYGHVGSKLAADSKEKRTGLSVLQILGLIKDLSLSAWLSLVVFGLVVCPAESCLEFKFTTNCRRSHKKLLFERPSSLRMIHNGEGAN